MRVAIIQKIEGRWVVDVDSTHIFEEEGGVFANGAVQEIQIAEITPLRKHPKDPSIDE